MSESFDWPVTRASLARLKRAWAGLQQELRRAKVQRLVFRALDTDHEQAEELLRYLVGIWDKGKQ